MKKVISVQPHVIERRAAGFPDIGTGFNVTFSELRDAGIAYQGPVNVLATVDKSVRFALDPQHPEISSSFNNILYLSTNEAKDQFSVLLQNANGTVVPLWTVQMPVGQTIVDVLAPGRDLSVSYLILRNDVGEHTVYKLNHQLGATPVSMGIRGEELRFLQPSANAQFPETFLIDGTKLKVLTRNALDLAESGLVFEFGSKISQQSYPSAGIYVGLPDMGAVAFIPSAQLTQLPPTTYAFFASQDPCDVNPLLKDGVTMFKSTPGSKFGASFYILNTGNSTVSLIGKPGVSQLVAMPVKQDGACLDTPVVTVQGENGFGLTLNKEVDSNPQSGSGAIKANYLPVAQGNGEIVLLPFNILLPKLDEGGGSTVLTRDMKPIKIGSLTPNGTLERGDASLTGGKFLSEFGDGFPVKTMVFPTANVNFRSFSEVVLALQAQRQALSSLPASTSEAQAAPTPSQGQPASPSPNSQPPSPSSSLPTSTTRTTTASSVVVTLSALTTAAIAHVNETAQSSNSNNSAGLSLPYLLLVVVIGGLAILAVLIIAAKAVISRSNRTGPQNGENPSLITNRVVVNPSFEEEHTYEELGNGAPPPVPNSARPGAYMVPTLLKDQIQPGSDHHYDNTDVDGTLVHDPNTVFYDVATLPLATEPGEEDAFSTDGEVRYDVASNGYLDVSSNKE